MHGINSPWSTVQCCTTAKSKNQTGQAERLATNSKENNMQNAIIMTSAVIGICACAMGLVMGLIYPPLAFLATVVFLGCIGAVILSDI